MSTNIDSQVNGNEIQLDALVVGAGFAGVHMLHLLREAGFSVKIFETGSDMGGIWYWNSYPGARVDSDLPVYQLTDEKLWKGWNWKEKFPGQEEIIDYFHHVDKKLGLTRDIHFNSRVVSAVWSTNDGRWVVRTENGLVARARFFIPCTGIGSSPYTPNFQGLESFKGQVHHTAGWPKGGVDFRGKRVGVIGTGATGVQTIQEVAPVVDHLTVFQRTPNLALPMNQKILDDRYQDILKKNYPLLFKMRHQTFGGFWYDTNKHKTFDLSLEERTAYWEEIWALGGFRFWLANFADMFTNQEANDAAYAFWRDKVRGRIDDPVLQEKLAPTVAPHPIGCKRPSLEQNYYEVFNRPNVTLVDLNEASLDRITEKGVQTKDGKEFEFDILILATGYDCVTGGITQIDIRGMDGISIKEKWKEGVRTYLGVTTANYPNMFFLYGPQAPTSFTNGPSTVELQAEWIMDLLKYAKDKGARHIEATDQAQEEWRNLVLELSSAGLWAKAKSWYMGANIPGKKIEPLNFAGGIPMYKNKIEACRDEGYLGFQIV